MSHFPTVMPRTGQHDETSLVPHTQHLLEHVIVIIMNAVAHYCNQTSRGVRCENLLS